MRHKGKVTRPESCDPTGEVRGTPDLTDVHAEPYPELPSVLGQFVDGVQDLLSENLVGIYLVGSLAVGGFDLDSDIDFLVVMNEELTDGAVSALQAMHVRTQPVTYINKDGNVASEKLSGHKRRGRPPKPKQDPDKPLKGVKINKKKNNAVVDVNLDETEDTKKKSKRGRPAKKTTTATGKKRGRPPKKKTEDK